MNSPTIGTRTPSKAQIPRASSSSTVPHPASGEPTPSGSAPLPRQSDRTSIFRRLSQVSESCQNFLKLLRDLTNEIGKNGIAPDIQANASGVGCSANHVVTVDMGNNSHEKIHANWFPAADNKRYLAGQSPDAEVAEVAEVDKSNPPPHTKYAPYEKFIMQGIESGQGVFQFVSRKAHYDPAHSKETPIIDQLMAKWNECNKSGNNLMLGGRYQVAKEPELMVNDGVVDDHKHYRLTVTDTLANPNTEHIITLTQAGLKFSGAVLHSKELRRASQLLDRHNTESVKNSKDKKHGGQAEPMIVSYAGGGRNATLISYRYVSEKIIKGEIETEEKLDEILSDFIIENRKIRKTDDEIGPKFVHSDAQVAALRETLLEELPNKKNSSGPSGRSVVAKVNKPVEAPVVAPTSGNRNTGTASHATSVKQPKASRTTALAALNNLFSLNNNIGGGDCLFHALDGDLDGTQCNLSSGAIKKIRNDVANIRKNDTDNTDMRKKTNAFLYRDSIETSNPGRLSPLNNGVNMISNKDYAVAQRIPGTFASDQEIRDWTQLERNKNTTLLVFDQGQRGIHPEIVTFSKGERESVLIRNLGNTEKEIRQNIYKTYSEYFNPENDPKTGSSSQRYRVILRQSMHFQRISGFSKRFKP